MIPRTLKNFFATSFIAVGVTFAPTICDFDGWQISSVAHAEINEYVGVGESIMSDRDTGEIAKQSAKLQAIRNAQEQARIFISNYSVMKDQELETDEVTAFTASVVKISDKVKYEPIPLGDDLGTIKFRATVIVTIDTDELTTKINEWLKRDQPERTGIIEQNKELLKIIDDLKKRNAELEQLIASTKQQDKTTVQEKLDAINKETLCAQKIQKGNKLFNAKKYEEALNVYTEALQIDPNNSVAYVRRGDAHRNLILRTTWDEKKGEGIMRFNKQKDFEKALEDFQKAVELDPKNYLAWYVRGNTYFDYAVHGVTVMEDIVNPNFKTYEYYAEAITAYTNAIELNPNFATAYNNRGVAHDKREQYDLSVYDYTKAIQLAPNNAIYYYNRGCAYRDGFKRYERALRDFEKTIKLAPKDYHGYYGCAETYKKMGDEANAKKYFKKSKSLDGFGF